jgi:hypothetical protein
MTCDWAACNRPRSAFSDGYWHCAIHYREHLDEFHPVPRVRVPGSSVRDACGTRGAYEWHRRHGEAPCDPCRAAKRVYSAAVRVRRLSLSA